MVLEHLKTALSYDTHFFYPHVEPHILTTSCQAHNIYTCQ